MEPKIVKKIGKAATKAVIPAVERKAARAAVVEVAKVVKPQSQGEHAALTKLRAVGTKVAEQITREAVGAGTNKEAAAKQGKRAGNAAVKFASTLIKKQLVKDLGESKAEEMIKRVVSKADKTVKHKAKKAAGVKGKKAAPAKKAPAKKGAKKLAQKAATEKKAPAKKAAPKKDLAQVINMM